MIIIIILEIILVIWVLLRGAKIKKIVLSNSDRIQTLLELNDTIQFRTIKSKYSYHQSCNSKRQLDHLNMDDYLITLIDSDETYFKNIIDSISFNQDSYNSYIAQTEAIESTAVDDYNQSFGFNLRTYLNYEKRLFKRKLLCKPQLDITVHCKCTYTSPKGRNYYWKEKTYNFIELKRFFDHTIELKKLRQTRQYQIQLERAKMTDSLRYDMLKRDNFRCQICGATAQDDGVKLHVDHIVPVSKGGRTIPSNLRTLCDRCNMGKSDKM